MGIPEKCCLRAGFFLSIFKLISFIQKLLGQNLLIELNLKGFLRSLKSSENIEHKFFNMVRLNQLLPKASEI